MAAPSYNAVAPDPKYGEMTCVQWTLTDADPTGTAISMAEYADRSVQIGGTFGSGTVVIQGSNEPTPSNYVSLTDPQGNAISKTSAAFEQISEASMWIRPSMSGSTGATVVVSLFLRRNRR